MNKIIETERLEIREILTSDIDGMFDLDADHEVHEYLGKQPVQNKEQSREVIAFIRQQYVDNGIGRWAIIDKQTQDFVGWTGLKYVTEATNNHINYYDLGYRLRKKYWGKGIATESAIASLRYAFDTLHTNEVYAMADINNDGSNNILQKIGFTRVETFDLDGVAHHWYKITKEEFSK